MLSTDSAINIRLAPPRRLPAQRRFIGTSVPVEIAVFAEGDGPPLYPKRHRVTGGRNTITVVVPRRPAGAAIDPFGKLIQRARDDNAVEVRPVAGVAR